MRFSAKVTVVTGADSGIGRATAIRLLDEGATVVAIDLKHTQPWPDQPEGRLCRLDLDVSGPDAAQRLEAYLRKEFQRVDVLANVAGILHIAPFLEESCYTTGACLDVDGGYAMDGSLPGTAYT